jgi:glycosyltransferase involved in cell wall biosynthesis
MRILMLNSEIPFPPITGAQSRTFHLLKGLSAEHDVTLVGFSWDSQSSPTICSLPVEVICVPWAPSEPYRKMYEGDPSVSQAAYRHLAYESAEPWFVSYYNSATMESLLAELMSRSFDLILIEHSFMARFLPFLRPDVPKVLDMHNVHTLMAWRRAQEKSGSEKDDAVKEFERIQFFEQTVCSACQLCLCCSDQDAEAARHFLNIEHSRVIPNGVDIAMMTAGNAQVTPGYLLFTGMMNYEPNLEAVRYFVKEILPLIRAEVPYATFHIAGTNPSPEVIALAAEGVYIHASVPDMRPYFHQACVVVVPLLHGGGTRLKILDAAACGKPIVSTSVGAEGLNFADGRDLLLADSAPGFAQTVIGLLSNPDRQAELSRWARRAAEAYDWSDIASEFCSVMTGIAQRHRGVRHSLQPLETDAAAHRESSYG